MTEEKAKEMNERSGTTRTNLSGELQYESFSPKPLPPSPALLIDEEMQELLLGAEAKLADLKALSQRHPQMSFFAAFAQAKEALYSSLLEGIEVTAGTILNIATPEDSGSLVAAFVPPIQSMPVLGPDGSVQNEPSERTSDFQKPKTVDSAHIKEVFNYMSAYEYGKERMEELPVCNRLLKDMHYVLMQSDSGIKKTPGEFCTSQNWLGAPGSTLADAYYVPPNSEDMEQAMSDLEKFINYNEDLHPLIKIALTYSQFTNIQPFLDGNGQISRMLINLMFLDFGLLSHDILSLSEYFYYNRLFYNHRLNHARRRGRIEEWVKFFLEAVNRSALEAAKHGFLR